MENEKEDYTVPSFSDRLYDLEERGAVTDEQLLQEIEIANTHWPIASSHGMMLKYGKEASDFYYHVTHAYAKRETLWDRLRELYPEGTPVVFEVGQKYRIGMDRKRIRQLSRDMASFIASLPGEVLVELHQFPGYHKTYCRSPWKEMSPDDQDFYIPGAIEYLAHVCGIVVVIHFTNRYHDGEIFGWRFGTFAEVQKIDSSTLCDILLFEGGRGIRTGKIAIYPYSPPFARQD